MNSGGSANALIDNRVLVHSLGVLSKDFCVIGKIDDLFLYAGAERNWRSELRQEGSSQRAHRVVEWVAGIRKNASVKAADRILRSYADLLLKDIDVDTVETYLVQQALDGHPSTESANAFPSSVIPSDVPQLLERVIKGLPRAMYAFRNRRKGKVAIEFSDEYDVQDLFYTLLLPWVDDIRAEEHTSSFAGASARPDFELRQYDILCEVKFVRDRSHAKRVNDELLIDITRYGNAGDWQTLYAIIYDPGKHLRNPAGLKADLESANEKLDVKTFVLQ